jgi:hypothetical protein
MQPNEQVQIRSVKSFTAVLFMNSDHRALVLPAGETCLSGQKPTERNRALDIRLIQNSGNQLETRPQVDSQVRTPAFNGVDKINPMTLAWMSSIEGKAPSRKGQGQY